MNKLIMLSHVFLGAACLLSSVWVFIAALNSTGSNQTQVRTASWASAIFMWLSFVVAGYWYVTSYGAVKAVILSGPWPFAHSFFMETKEHLAIILLLLATYLPIASAGKDARRLVLWVSGLVILLALAMMVGGIIIAMGIHAGFQAQ